MPNGLPSKVTKGGCMNQPKEVEAIGKIEQLTCRPEGLFSVRLQLYVLTWHLYAIEATCQSTKLLGRRA